MFGIDESPKGTLDMDASFNIGKGLLSVAGIIKFITLAIAVASEIYSFTATSIPEFYPAYLTPWGVFFGILHLAGSFVLTVFYSKGTNNTNTNNTSVLVKITWLLYSVAGVIGCCITVLFWVAVFNPDKDNDMLDKIMMHGGVVSLIILQGILLDRVPMRLKHIVFSDGVALLFTVWLILQNTMKVGNPHDDDDDDAIYDTMKWRTETTSAIIQAVLVVFVAVPLFQVLLWAASLPGRRYLSGSNGGAENINEETPAAAVDEEKAQVPESAVNKEEGEA